MLYDTLIFSFCAWKEIQKVLVCHSPVLDGFNWLLQTSGHFALCSLLNPSDIKKFQRNIFVNVGNWTCSCWARSKNATSVLCSPITHSSKAVTTFSDASDLSATRPRLLQDADSSWLLNSFSGASPTKVFSVSSFFLHSCHEKERRLVPWLSLGNADPLLTQTVLLGRHHRQYE